MIDVAEKVSINDKTGHGKTCRINKYFPGFKKDLPYSNCELNHAV